MRIPSERLWIYSDHTIQLMLTDTEKFIQDTLPHDEPELNSALSEAGALLLQLREENNKRLGQSISLPAQETSTND